MVVDALYELDELEIFLPLLPKAVPYCEKVGFMIEKGSLARVAVYSRCQSRAIPHDSERGWCPRDDHDQASIVPSVPKSEGLDPKHPKRGVQPHTGAAQL